MADASLNFRRVLLKLSGEALMGEGAYGIDLGVVDRLAAEVAAAKTAGADIALVVGGGNIYRGLAGVAQGMDRTTGDYMGMLATVMNGLAVAHGLERAGLKARVLSAIPMPTVCEPFTQRAAREHLAEGRVVVFAAGTGNPFFTTDTAGALRAIEMGCDCLLKGTQVDGVYSDDPKRNPSAEHFARLDYATVLARDLKVMDGAAIALARDNRLPIIVFSLWEEGSLLRALRGQGRHTLVTA